MSELYPGREPAEWRSRLLLPHFVRDIGHRVRSIAMTEAERGDCWISQSTFNPTHSFEENDSPHFVRDIGRKIRSLAITLAGGGDLLNGFGCKIGV